jgi:hypothetical protein
MRTLFLLTILFFSLNVFSQDKTSYTYSISIENSEILDYRLEQNAALTMLFRAKEALYDTTANVFLIRVNKLHNLSELKQSIEKKEMNVIGEIKVKINNTTIK